MQLNDNLARQIVARAMKILSFSVNVMDEHGLIIASGNPERIHQRHEGAVLALTENRVVEISEATALQLKGVRPGINLPISYQGELIGVIGISGDPEEVRAYAELVRMTAELILEQAALTEQLQWDKRHTEELVLQLIRGEGRVDQLQQAARFLGLELAQPRVVAVLALEEADPARLRELVHQLENPERDNLVAINGLDEIVVLKPAQLSDGVWQSAQERSRIKQLLARIPHFKVHIAVGDYFAGIDGLARSYQTARDTLRRGMRQAPRKQVYFFEDYRLPVLLGSLADSWQADQLRTPLQKLAREDGKGALQKTLRHYFLQDCDLHRCAEALFIHPNTLRYRLGRIEQITGLNFNKLDDKFLLYLGLNLDL
ncbi:sugar diacid recognition domain-containing protein [Aeromonas veronii]|uniref:sugar diacid recognition domain-containing protein n=1 Tax=Aeromonas veronii TaxID=654 RepID=UPI000390EC67|nr:sugar diacid recognition domain-containing protein [Aeromonas veronii]QMS77107.1 helix-turn-helix domain-containing protein [Aeromonas veronii Hm21]